MRSHRVGRAGFGTTTTFVLVIIGIALLILLGGDLLSRGSRVNIERAYATGQLLRVGRMALDEAFTSDKGKQALADSMLQGLASKGSGGGSVPQAGQQRDDLILQFLQVCVPMDGNQHPFPSVQQLYEAYKDQLTQPAPNVLELDHKWPLGDPNTAPTATGMTWLQVSVTDADGTVRPQVSAVRFGILSTTNAKVPLVALKDAYKTEIDNGKLVIETDGQKNVVEIRPVVFHVIDHQVRPGSYLGSRNVGRGLARARVGLRWVLDKGGVLVRTVVSEYFFNLHAPATLGKDWKIEFDDTEYQRGTVDDSEHDV